MTEKFLPYTVTLSNTHVGIGTHIPLKGTIKFNITCMQKLPHVKHNGYTFTRITYSLNIHVNHRYTHIYVNK